MGETEAEVARELAIEKVLQLREVNDVQQICTGLNVVVPPGKAGKLLSVRNLLIVHLSSPEVEASDDEGLQLFRDVAAQVDAITAKQNADVKKENGGSGADVVPKVEGGQSSVGTDDSKTTVNAVTGVLDSAAVDSAAATGAGKALTGASVVTNLGRLKDFKLYGTIGDGKHCLGYGTICHRIEQGKAQGYPFEEILDVVIRSIEAGSQLQRYFDGHRKMPEAEFLAILKNHYNHEGYMKLLMQLGKGRQGPKEKTMDFVYRMTRLRNDIIAVAKDEGVTVDAEGVNKQCFYAISVGISSNTVRLELGNVLKNTSLKDFELFREVNAAVTREEEYLKLLEESKEVQAKTNNIRGGRTKGGNARRFHGLFFS